MRITAGHTLKYIDCYTTNDLEGFPTSTYKVDIPENELDAALLELSKYFTEVREVTETNGQAKCSMKTWKTWNQPEVKLKPNPDAIRRLC